MNAHADDTLDATLALLRYITPFRSVSGEREQQRCLAAWLENWMVSELQAEVVLPVGQQPDDAPPLVHVRINTGASRNLTLYNMYDVMPASPEGWEADPFVGSLCRWPELGDVFVARGAENNKGPLAGMLTVVRELVRGGDLPVNLDILLEGEEEVGSGHLRRYLARTPCPLPSAEAVLFPSLCEYGGGAPRLYLGFTGMTSGRLRVRGGSWGGPHVAIHASNAAWIANPIWRLVDALQTLAPTGANGVLVTHPPDEAAAQLIDALAEHFSVEDELHLRRSERLTLNGDAPAALRHLLGSAVLNVSEISSMPVGGRGIIPPQAEAALALRTPPGIDPALLLQRMWTRLGAPELTGAELAIDDSYPGYRFDIAATGVRELIDCYHRQQARPQIWPWAPGCAPAYAFASAAPAFLLGGLGYGGNAHGVNEFVTLRGLERFTRSLRDWLRGFD